jgi:hypothetical protein
LTDVTEAAGADRLSLEERKQAIEIFEGRAINRVTGVLQQACVHCAGVHDRVDGLPQYRQPCQRIKRAVWSGDELIEVEYWRDDRWDQSNVIFPADAYETFEDEEEMPDAAR